MRNNRNPVENRLLYNLPCDPALSNASRQPISGENANDIPPAKPHLTWPGS
ncbi:hypothetical protein ACFONG_05855 [Uliginosibacterium paludis]|uniref:Uncharacterized protein n=1 Tax=Uliginosibacterium paludis TaxID=1615952 RepID=A0ABV2CV72_9RHOO